MPRTPGLVLLLLASTLPSSGCLYKFTGGGLPAGIRTVAVLPFDNLTPDPTLPQEISRAVREAVESRLGLRPAGEDNADAIVSGSIQRYEPDLPLAFTGQTPNKVTEVTRRMVQITLKVQILDAKNNKVLWQQQALLVQGAYDPGREADGRREALKKLVNDIVDGAQSQW